MLEQALNNINLYIFAKDKHSKYLFCNENFAQVAGLDSPAQIVGKTDFDLYWNEQADFFRHGDALVLNGNPRINVPEIQKQPNKIANILVTKTKLFGAEQKCIGVVGSYMDITGYSIIKNAGHFDPENDRLYLGETFDNQYLTKREVDIFKYILYGYTSEKIATLLNISSKTAQGYTEIIKRKLQCSSKSEIMSTAIRHGLTYILFEQYKWKKNS